MPVMADGIRAPKGTNDLLPPVSWEWEAAVRRAAEMFRGAGYAPIETPVFENTELFERGVGTASEVVTKQMYTFEDMGGRSLTLRPEGTAPVVRSVIEHNLHRGALPLKLYYYSPMFRQERPQKGRYRQFFQVGVEAIGSDSPSVDAEVIELGGRFISSCGVEHKVRLNSIGHVDPSCRQAYLASLVTFLEENSDRLAEDDRSRIETNPLRTFDSKEKATIEVMRDAPLITDHVCDACKKHFEEVRASLDDVGVQYEIDGTLVRGLDYYTRTTFEYQAVNLGSQDAVGGGGRYDGLSEALGGPPLPGIGFALGVDRILVAAGRFDQQAEIDPRVTAYVVTIGDEARRAGFELAIRLRRAGIATELDHGGRAMKGQMKDASRSGAKWTLILGEDEIANRTVTVKNMDDGQQETIAIDEVEGKIG
jgi:histidyl-tRNA synthetase